MRLASLMVLVFSTSLISQTTPSTPVRDAEALQVAQLAVAASGLLTSGQIADLTETGTITYNWANQNAEGPVKITEIGTTDVQLSAALPSGNYRWFASDGRGKRQTDGRVQAIPYHCGVSQVAFTIPVLRLAQALGDGDYELKYLSTTDEKNGSQYRIAIKYLAGRNAAEQEASALDAAEFVIDPQTYLIVELKDVARSETDMFNTVPRTLSFSDYHTAEGIRLPFAIEENVNGAHTWSLHIDSAALNTGTQRTAIQF